MPRIESVRPGEVMESNFRESPLPEVLVGILRGNLSGLLSVDLEDSAANFLYFRDGVPVSVTLPGLEVSLSAVLVERGELGADAATELDRQKRATQLSESRLIHRSALVGEGALREGMRRRARLELAQLIRRPDTAFSFREGAPMPEEAELAVLQTLPIIYEGLVQLSADARSVYAARVGPQRYRLTETYPRGVDAFEWGESVERVISQLEAGASADQLVGFGLSREQAIAALSTLLLVGMARPVESSAPRLDSSAPELDLGAPSAPRSQPAGDQVLPSFDLFKRNGMSETSEADERKMVAPRSPSQVSADHQVERQNVARAVDPLRGKTYFDLLRVLPNTKPGQIERSHQYLVRQFAKGDGRAPGAVEDLFQEAFDVITSDTLGATYRKLAKKDTQKGIRKRMAFEARFKVERTAIAIATNHFGEASYLLDWAEALDPEYPGLPGHRAFLRFCLTPAAEKPAVASEIKGLIRTASETSRNDLDLRRYLIITMVATGEGAEAKALFAGLPETEHPLQVLAGRAVAAVG